MRTEARFSAWIDRVESHLGTALPAPSTSPGRLHEAMRHAVLGGGKRMRPLLVYASGQACGAADAVLDAAAAAVELIHAYSLVHDDLPAMDDDALRRGRPTVHVAFDEATAILAGDALQAAAFSLLSQAPLPPQVVLAQMQALAMASGSLGMCGGQALDLAATGTGAQGAQAAGQRLQALETLHALKTGALIRACVRLGALAAGSGEDTLHKLDEYATALGLAFQIRDDILDVEGDAGQLGKTAGKDAAQDKMTFPALIGLDASRQRLRQLAAQMDATLASLDADTAALQALGRLAIERQH